MRDGDSIALQTEVLGRYLSAINGGGASVVADRTAIQSWETFVIGGIGSGSTGTGNECGGAQLAACNCPSGFYCCPIDGSCFTAASDVIYTKCKDNAGATCHMGSSPPPVGRQ